MKKKIRNTYLREIMFSVILVTHNDAEIIETILQQTKSILSKNYSNYEIIIIDNGSTDLTLKNLQTIYKQIPHLKIIKLAKTYRVEVAYTAGLDNCIGDYAILFNFHLVSVSIIPDFFETLFKGYDIVALRFKEPLFSKWSVNGIFLSLLESLSKKKFSYEPAHVLGFTRKVITNFTRTKRKSRNFLYINNVMGFKKAIIECMPLQDTKNRKKRITFLQFLLTMIDILITNSFKPLRLLTVIGVFASLIFFFFSFFAIIFTFVFHTPIIQNELIAIIIFFSIVPLLLFSILAMIAEYIIRISEDTKNEPTYYVADEIDSPNILRTRKEMNIV